MGHRVAEPLGIVKCMLGEGPLWAPGSGVLHFVDIDGHTLHEYCWAEATHRERTFDGPVCCVADAGGDKLLVALDDRLALLADGLLTTVWAGGLPTGVRFNDGKCDPLGRFFVGSTHRSFEDGHGSLYRLDKEVLSPVLEGLGISNGLAWTADGTRMLHIDTLKRQIAVYDYDLSRGELMGPSRALDVSHLPGLPDGMTIDVEDCIWVAFWDGGYVVRLDLDGAVLQKVHVPVPKVTSCCFAGPDLDTLVITTAKDPKGGDPFMAGDLFRFHPGVQGATTAVWRGV